MATSSIPSSHMVGGIISFIVRQQNAFPAKIVQNLVCVRIAFLPYEKGKKMSHSHTQGELPAFLNETQNVSTDFLLLL